MDFHILTPSIGDSLAGLKSSALASSRLRLAPAFEAAAALGFSVSVGDICPDSAELLLIGKIGSNEISRRAPRWLDHLHKVKQRGGRILLDYTDHHLETNSVMSPFYEQAISEVSTIITPTAPLASDLARDHKFIVANTVSDLLEYSPVRPNRKTLSGGTTAIWFGHPSNAAFLAQFIDANAARMASHRLIIVSSEPAIDILKRHAYRSRPSTGLAFIPWSPANLISASRQADYCLIPSDKNSPKRYASNNRLVTALTLGLPTIATPIPSYQEFSEYFAEEGTQQADELMANPNVAHNKIVAFQDTEISRFQLPSIITAWQKLLLA